MRLLAVLSILPALLILAGPVQSAPGTIPGSVADPAADSSPTIVHVERGTTVSDLIYPHGRVFGATDLDPGVAPEGDYLGWCAFTPDGQRVLLTNRATDNVTVFDWSTMAVLANIRVGRYPSGIAVSGELAVVACSFSDEVYVIDLDDYSVDAIIPTGVQPWVVRLSPDGSRAYVSCDIDDVCEVIDLPTLSHVFTIPGFPVALERFTFTSENGRNSVYFTNFEVTPDGGHLVVGDWNDSVLFFNTTTGVVEHTIAGIPNCVSVALSGDGTRVIAASASDPYAVHQIDLATHTKTATVTFTGHQVGWTFELAVNQDGSKAFASVSGNASAIARFTTQDARYLTSTFSPFWIGVTPDHTKAISGQFYFSMVDLATETLLGQHSGNTQEGGAVSPVGGRVASIGPTSHEGVYFYDTTNPAAPAYRGTTSAGADVEGDAPRRVAITPDGGKAIITDVLSDNATIVNLSTHAVEAILPIGDRVQDVAVTSDSRWAVVCGMNSNTATIIDLATNTTVAEVACGSRPAVVSISPDDAFAYVGDISSNTISVIQLDGAASVRVAQVPSGEIGVVWAGYGVLSDVKTGPTGQYVLVAASFDDQVRVISTATNTVVATLPVGDFPLQLAFNGAGDYATVTNYFASTVTVMRIAGAGSSVVGTFARGNGPLRLAYNPVLDQTLVGNYTAKTVARLNPQTGALLGTLSYAAYGNVLQVLADENGQPIVLTVSGSTPPGHLHRGGDAIPLPVTPSYFDYNSATGKAVVVGPGPDIATIVTLDPAGTGEAVAIPLSKLASIGSPEPNPAAGAVRFPFVLARPAEVVLTLVDVGGREVATILRGRYESGKHVVSWEPAGIAAGMYFAVLRAGAHEDRTKVMLLEGEGR